MNRWEASARPIRSSRKRRRRLAPVAIVALTIACSACGGDDSFEPEEVADVFARHGIPLIEHRAGDEGDPLLSILSPSQAPDRCSDDLRINIFRGTDEVDAQLARSGFKPGENRYVFRSDDGRAVVALAHSNVLVSLTESDCFSEARVRQPLNALGR